jgi:hypothetical protein
MTGRPTTTDQGRSARRHVSFKTPTQVNPQLTENGLRTHCDGLNDVAPCTDSRIEEDCKLALFLRATHPRRCSDLLESVERANGAINLSATYAPKEQEVPSTYKG